jgi:preprotein translocase subunit SecD
MRQVLEILTNRIDKFGVTEPVIRQQGSDEIAIEIPGPADPSRVQSFLTGKGSLAFHIEDTQATQKLNRYMEQHPSDALNENGQPKDPNLLPAGDVVRGFYKTDAYGLLKLVRYIVIKSEMGLDGNHITNAQVGTDPITNRPVINFSLDKEGADIFYKLTSANVGQTLSIVLDGKVRAGARISEPIRGNVQVSGFARAEAQDLAIVLRTGALPVDLEIESEQAVGASLGQDAIRQGLQAITFGFILVVVFMLFYYKGSGVIADMALILNLFIMIAILSVFNLTLTLTSIAGLILTVGMAVDANVIIYERIREEYRLGKSPEASVKAGFRKAFWTIMDSNITTIIAAIFLSQLGTGPVQGFAYTLAVGIVSSLFTALFVSRMVFDFLVEQMRVRKLSIDWRRR